MEQIGGMTKKEFRKKIMKERKKFSGDQLDDIEEKLEDLQNQLNSTDEEIYQGLKEHFVQEEILRQQKKFDIKNMIIEGSHILSLFSVTSILCPRHVRWTLTFGCIAILWFICAVIFNNTQDPLQVPDLNKDASSQAITQLWVGALAPMGGMVLIIDLRKEMRIRFFMGYGILLVIFGVIFWYVVSFTSDFGWKVSWIWWYCGVFAIFFQFLILDPLIAFLHFGVYKFNKRLGQIIMQYRSLKQAQCEILKNPFDDDDDQDEQINDGLFTRIKKGFQPKTKKGYQTPKQKVNQVDFNETFEQIDKVFKKND